MRLSTFVIGANERLEIAASGNYIRVRESAADLLIENPRTNEVIEVSQGDDFEFDQFSSLYVTNLSASQVTVKLIFSQDKKAGSSKVGGSVVVSNNAGSFQQGRVSLTNVTQQLLAANADRRYLLVQNNDSSRTMRLTLDGTAPSATAGFRVGAGESIELSGFVCSNTVSAFMEVASAEANNVEFVEG